MSKALMVGVWLAPNEVEQFERLKTLLGHNKNAPVFRTCFEIVSKAIEEGGTTDGTKPRKIRSQLDIWRAQNQ
jgi:hypothetical protein